MAFLGTQQKCKACEKTVYLVDQLVADDVFYHKACFRCHHCKGTLKLSNYASLEGVLYCKPHFDQLFKLTGSFDKSFDTGLASKHSIKASDHDKSKEPSKLSSHFSGTMDKCVVCEKIVYPIEKVTVEGQSFHKPCFKCAHGGCIISPSNYQAHEGRLYCKHHYTQLFREKGNFSNLTKISAPAKPGLESKLSDCAYFEGVPYCKPHFDQLIKVTSSSDKNFDTGLASNHSIKAHEHDKSKESSKLSLYFSGTMDKCIVCEKIVYPIEKVSVEEQLFHKPCFKCEHGGCIISPSSYQAHEGSLFCKHHYIQLFREKGNFSNLTKIPAPIKPILESKAES